MNISMRELTEMLHSNPELRVDDPYMAPAFAPRMDVGRVSEADMQKAVIDACNARAVTDPRYARIFHPANGELRSKATAGKLKSMGVKAGVPDLVLPIMRHGYGALFLELKISPNKQSETQREWMRNLQSEGYFYKVVWDSVDEVMAILEWYLNGDSSKTP